MALIKKALERNIMLHIIGIGIISHKKRDVDLVEFASQELN